MLIRAFALLILMFAVLAAPQGSASAATQTVSNTSPPVLVVDGFQENRLFDINLSGFVTNVTITINFAKIGSFAGGGSCGVTPVGGSGPSLNSEISFWLRSPESSTVTLIEAIPGPATYTDSVTYGGLVHITFDDSASAQPSGYPQSGTFKPANPLDRFIGQQAGGNWTLTAAGGVDPLCFYGAELTVESAPKQVVNFLQPQVNPINPNAPIPLSALAVDVETGTPTGAAIQYTVATPGICTVTGTMLSLLTVGTCIVSAQAAAIGEYPASLPALRSVARKPQVITVNFPASVKRNTVFGIWASSHDPATNAQISPQPAFTFTSLTPTVCTVLPPVNASQKARIQTLNMMTAQVCQIRVDAAATPQFGATATIRQFSVVP